MTEEWSKDKEKKILRKYRFALTYRIIAVGLVIFTIFILYNLVLSISYDRSTRGEKLRVYGQLYVDWIHPEITASTNPPVARISPNLTQQTSIPVQRKVGKERMILGEFEVVKPFITSLTRTGFSFYNPQDSSNFNFFVPKDPENNLVLSAPDSSGAWEVLDRVHEGTVADLAFSTSTYHTPEELFHLLEGYDLKVNWMPLYMGETTNFTRGYGSQGEYMLFEPWGLTHGREIDENYWVGSIYYMGYENVETVQSLMLENMRRLYEEDSNLMEAVFSSRDIENRIEFVEREGFMVYGAVVTGPTKELLRLQEVEEIRGVQIGEITHWNWVE